MTWLIVLAGYLIGSIPTAYIAGHLLRGVDIRQIGDGNMGAANAYRQLGVKAGFAVGIIDAAKGVGAVLLARALSGSEPVAMLAGAAAVVGHNWTIWLGFRGGRGESTTIGVLLAVLTQPMLIVVGPAIAALIIKKNVILASAVMFIPLPAVCWLLGLSLPLIIYSIGMPCLVGFTHYLRTRNEVAPRERHV